MSRARQELVTSVGKRMLRSTSAGGLSRFACHQRRTTQEHYPADDDLFRIQEKRETMSFITTRDRTNIYYKHWGNDQGERQGSDRPKLARNAVWPAYPFQSLKYDFAGMGCVRRQADQRKGIALSTTLRQTLRTRHMGQPELASHSD